MIPYINSNGIYQGKIHVIPATPPDVGFYAPEGAIIASSEPPTDEPGKWLWDNEQWKELSISEAIQIKENNIRNQRNALISETDYLMMPDYPISSEKLEEIKAYRQALRDITNQFSFPDSVEWPIKPTL